MRTMLFPDLFTLADAPVNTAARSHVEENQQGYFLQLDLPGVAKEDLRVTTENRHLVIEGERKGRFAGNVRRVYSLPDDVATDAIEAQLQNGVLELALPKKEAAKPKQISVGEGKESFFAKLLGDHKATEKIA